jgi:hypothetical protein
MSPVAGSTATLRVEAALRAAVERRAGASPGGTGPSDGSLAWWFLGRGIAGTLLAPSMQRKPPSPLQHPISARTWTGAQAGLTLAAVARQVHNLAHAW